jgi:hypothetical protein
VTIGLTMPSRASSASVLPLRMSVYGLVALCEVTAPAARLYPNGYTVLTQRLVLRPSNQSNQSNDHKYFNTIHEQDVWPAGC